MSLLDDIRDHLERAKRYDNYVSGLCPFHEDSRPSFLVYEDFYNCVACGARGTTKSLLDKISGTIVVPRIDNYHNPFTSWLKKSSLSKILKLAWENNKRNPSIYLRDKRNIPEDVQIKLGIGMMDDWITFPIRDENGKIIGAVARAGEDNPSSSKYVVPQGQDQNLIYVPSWKKIGECSKVYCTFGILDSVTLFLYGVASFSTTGGKKLSDVSVLDNIRKLFIFLPDAGEEKEALEISSRLGWRGKVQVIKFPDICKDVNDIHCRYPKIIRSILEA